MDFFQQIDNIALLEPAAHFELFRSISNDRLCTRLYGIDPRRSH